MQAPRAARQLAVGASCNRANRSISLIDLLKPGPEANNRGFQVTDQTRLLAGLDALDHRLQEAHGRLELLKSFSLRGRDADREIPDAFGQLVPQDRKGGLAMRHDQNPPARGHVVADDVGDRVRLARAGRSLDDNAIGAFQTPDDLDLIIVEGLGEEEVRCLSLRRRLGCPADGLADAIAQRSPDVVRLRGGGPHHEGLSRARQTSPPRLPSRPTSSGSQDRRG